MDLSPQDRQIGLPRPYRFAVLLRHHPDDLPDVAEVVHHPVESN